MFLDDGMSFQFGAPAATPMDQLRQVTASLLEPYLGGEIMEAHFAAQIRIQNGLLVVAVRAITAEGQSALDRISVESGLALEEPARSES